MCSCCQARLGSPAPVCAILLAVVTLCTLLHMTCTAALLGVAQVVTVAGDADRAGPERQGQRGVAQRQGAFPVRWPQAPAAECAARAQGRGAPAAVSAILLRALGPHPQQELVLRAVAAPAQLRVHAYQSTVCCCQCCRWGGLGAALQSRLLDELPMRFLRCPVRYSSV